MFRLSFHAFAFIAILPLCACQDMQSGMSSGYSNIKQAFSNFHPFENTTQVAVNPTEKNKTILDSLASDSTFNSNCPNVRIVQDLNQVHQFVDNAKPNPTEAISSIRMENVESKCQVVKNNLAIDMTVAFDGNLGPKARTRAGDKPSFAYPYFVAITNNQGSIIAKEVFAVTLVYDSGQNHETHTEQLRQMIPMGDKDLKNYKVLIGFQLNDQELAFNRAIPTEMIGPANSVTTIEPAAGEAKTMTPMETTD
jgi:hypothetical protein